MNYRYLNIDTPILKGGGKGLAIFILILTLLCICVGIGFYIVYTKKEKTTTVAPAAVAPGDSNHTTVASGGSNHTTTIAPWKVETGVCRDNDGHYPKWSDYNNKTLSWCESTCAGDSKCQGFAMNTSGNYCQLFGSDGHESASKAGTVITKGDASQSGYKCYLKKSFSQ